MKERYYVLGNEHGAIIELFDRRTTQYHSYLGSFQTFKEAKEYAIEYTKNKIECYKSDISMCKDTVKELRSIKKSDL